MIGGPYVPPNPWTWSAYDPAGLAISISIGWRNNRALQSVTITRDVGCQLSRVMVGTGPDGRPDSAQNIDAVPEGTTSVPVSVLKSRGLGTIDAVVALQVTAG